MRISIIANKFQFDKPKIQDAVFASMRAQMLIAMQKFLQVAASSVPIDTGMARGSFLNMQHLLELNHLTAGVKIPSDPQRLLKNGKTLTYVHSGGGRYPKTPQTARDKFSTPIGQIIKKVGTQIQFSYKSDVVHFGINDEFNPQGDNWYAFRRGSEAFANSIRQFKPIDVTQYLLKVSYTYGTHKSGYTNQSVEKTVQ